jgi:hypothetical protein
METISREDLNWWSQLSYFFGVWLGDGHYIWNPITSSYEIGIVSMDLEILTKAEVELSSSLQQRLKPHHYEEVSPSGTKLYRLRYYSIVLTDFICRATAYKQSLPYYIWQASKESKLNLLSGLMDTDGTIVVQKEENCRAGFFYTLKFSGGKGFVREFPDLCRTIGIKITSEKLETHENPNHADRWIYNLSLPSAVDNGFKFHCRRKQARLDDYLEKRKTRYQKVPSETTR